MAAIRKTPCTVTEIWDYGEHVYRITLTPKERLPRFSAGQFLHLALDKYDPSSFWPESRVFSIASSPSRTEPLEILYSVKGSYTSRMEKELLLGKEVWVKLPYGDFIFNDLNSPRILFAGGTGISAFTSLLNSLHQSSEPAPITLIYGIRNISTFFYKKMIEALAQEKLCKKIILFVEHGSTDNFSQNGIILKYGRINLDTITSDVFVASAKSDFYLAGPPPMLKMLKDRLHKAMIPDSKIYMDKWE